MAAAIPSEPEVGSSGCSDQEAADRLVDADLSWRIATNIGMKWKRLGRMMGLTDAKLDNIEARYRDDREEMAYQMLLVWRETKSQEATVKALAQHLKEIRRVDLACDILKLAKESKTNSTIMQTSRSYQMERRVLHDSGLQEHRCPTPPISHEELKQTWASLKATLQIENKRQMIPRIPWLKEWEMNFEDYYIELTINDKNDTKTRNLQLHEIFIPTKGSALRAIYSKVFRSHAVQSPTRILIEGPAGYGKSTLARKLCFDHANGEEYVRHFEAIILLRLRDFKGTLEEMITNTLQLKDYCSKQVFETIIHTQKKLLFVLDGFDELPKDSVKHVIPLLKGNQLPQATVVVTSRLGYFKLENEESDSSVANLLHCVQSRITINGITGENRSRFLKLHLKDYSSEKIAFLLMVIENKFGLEENLFDCPLFLLLLVVIADETDIATLKTKTELYKHLFNFLLRRMFSKEDHADQKFDFFEFDDGNPPVYVEMLCRFGSFAGEALDKGKYSFTAEEILESSRNDNTILKLGILTQNDTKTGQKRKSWFEPLHLSFLEFSFAYSIWVSVVRVQFLFCSSLTRNLVNIVELLKRHNLVASFLFGLCGKQLITLLSAFVHTSGRFSWLKFIDHFDNRELVAESQLELHELAKAFKPLIPTDWIAGSIRGYLKETILHKSLLQAVQTRTNQRIIHWQCFLVHPEHISRLPLKVVPDLNYSKRSRMISQDWSELITDQDLLINNSPNEGFKFTLAICSAPLDQQLNWLSNFMVIEGFYATKPIREIYYCCSELQLVGTFSEIAELIRQEKVESVTFDNRYFPIALPLDPWTEFLGCANHSKQLLDMSLHVQTESPLLIDFGGQRGKTWRRIELEGDVIPWTGSPLDTRAEQGTWDLVSFIRQLPTRISTLVVQSHVCIIPFSVFVQDGGSSLSDNLCQLHITFNSNSKYLLESCVWKYLQKLQVLAVGISPGFKPYNQNIITFISSMISHCRLLKRLELWEGCTDELITTFLQRLSTDTGPEIINEEQSVTTNLHVDTLMLSPVILTKNEIYESNTVGLARQLLMSGSIQHLWISCTDFIEGYAKRDFLKLFAPAEGFSCKLALDSDEENDLWKYTRLLRGCNSSMFIFKISAN